MDVHDHHLPGLGAVAVALVGSGALLVLLSRRGQHPPRNAARPLLGSFGAEMAVRWFEDAAGVAERRNARPRPATRAADVDLADFARTVLAIAEGVAQDPTADDLARGRFGTRKVFIAAIRRGLRDTAYARLPRADVDELLLKARRDGLLSLARADLVAAMDPAELRDSEITHPLIGSTVHFVVSETP